GDGGGAGRQGRGRRGAGGGGGGAGAGADGPERAPGEPAPSEVVGDAERAASVRALVDGLSEDHATVIRLVHQEGLTLVEAGRRMGRSPDATRMLYGRAMQRLASELPDDGGGTPPVVTSGSAAPSPSRHSRRC